MRFGAACLRGISASVLAGASDGLKPLAWTYHERTEGRWVGPKLYDSRNLAEALPGMRGADASRRLADASMLEGDVARTVVAGEVAQLQTTGQPGAVESGASIFGPFEAGFGPQQDFLIEGFGCDTPSACYSAGGMDTQVAEAFCAKACGLTMPRWDDGVYVAFLDTCGGHTSSYHFHQNFSCLYDLAGGHSTRVGVGTDDASTPLYGKWEDYETRELPELDACGAHYGTTPDSDASVYHHHAQDGPPFAFGCYGPNDDGSLVTVEQCRDIYDTCDGDVEMVDTYEGEIPYDAYCPCWDGSGAGFAGAGLNTGLDIVPLSATSPSPTLASRPIGPLAPTTPSSPSPTAALPSRDGPPRRDGGPGSIPDDGAADDGAVDDGAADGGATGDNTSATVILWASGLACATACVVFYAVASYTRHARQSRAPTVS